MPSGTTQARGILGPEILANSRQNSGATMSCARPRIVMVNGSLRPQSFRIHDDASEGEQCRPGEPFHFYPCFEPLLSLSRFPLSRSLCCQEDAGARGGSGVLVLPWLTRVRALARGWLLHNSVLITQRGFVFAPACSRPGGSAGR